MIYPAYYDNNNNGFDCYYWNAFEEFYFVGAAKVKGESVQVEAVNG